MGEEHVVGTTVPNYLYSFPPSPTRGIPIMSTLCCGFSILTIPYHPIRSDQILTELHAKLLAAEVDDQKGFVLGQLPRK